LSPGELVRVSTSLEKCVDEGTSACLGGRVKTGHAAHIRGVDIQAGEEEKCNERGEDLELIFPQLCTPLGVWVVGLS
jgi:hypothetical protein